MKNEINVKPHKAYLLSLGKKYREMTPEEHKIYNRLGNQWRYDPQQSKQYYLDNQERCLEYEKKRREENPAYHRDYYWSNKEQAMAIARKSYRRRKDTLIGKVRYWFGNVKWRTSESGSFEEIVGCSESEFIDHIESLFTEGMSWDNWGTGPGKSMWHVDHMHEVSKGGSNHYTNLQPLWCIDNHHKSNKKH